MIKAGTAILVDYEWGWSDPKDFVERIYKAMQSVYLS